MGIQDQKQKTSDKYTISVGRFPNQMTIYMRTLQVDRANVLTRQRKKKGEELESNELTIHHDPDILPLGTHPQEIIRAFDKEERVWKMPLTLTVSAWASHLWHSCIASAAAVASSSSDALAMSMPVMSHTMVW